MHQKQRAIAWPLKRALGLALAVPSEIDTDQFGTFSGEVPRSGSPLETVLKKARLGMEMTGCSLGLANEGTFGSHPASPFLQCDHEVMVFVDDDLGFSLTESVLSTRTRTAMIQCKTLEEAFGFAAKAGFPEYGLIVRPVSNKDPGVIFKGIRDHRSLAAAVNRATDASPEHGVQIESDLRAHHNPARMRVIRQLAAKLARRLRTLCPWCDGPGFGRTRLVPGLPCECCGCPTEMILHEIHECLLCRQSKVLPRPDDLKIAGARHCPACNP